MALRVPIPMAVFACMRGRYGFIHPVSKELIELEAPLPEGNLWKGFELTRLSTVFLYYVIE